MWETSTHHSNLLARNHKKYSSWILVIWVNRPFKYWSASSFSFLLLLCLHPTTSSQYFSITHKDHTSGEPPHGAKLPHFFPVWKPVSPSFVGLNFKRCFCCVKHSRVRLSYVPSLFQLVKKKAWSSHVLGVIFMTWVPVQWRFLAYFERSQSLDRLCMFSRRANWSQMSNEWTWCNSSRTHWNWVFTCAEALLRQGNHSSNNPAPDVETVRPSMHLTCVSLCSPSLTCTWWDGFV